MKQIAVLGAGMIGSVIAQDLSSEYYLTVFDKDILKLNRIPQSGHLRCKQIDLLDPKIFSNAIGSSDLVVSAVSSIIGHKVLKSIIENGKNVVDITFSAEDPFMLDEIAKKNNVTAIVDCGVAPGLGNIILGYYNKSMKIDSYACYVGGLPFNRTPPFEYKAPFAPMDVIEEYTRPSRVVENGKEVVKPAMSEQEILAFDEIGELEAFNTDGLRSLLKTMKIPNMIEKTIRYPGHIDKIKFLRDAGFFAEENISMTSKILLDHWKLEEREREFTVMRIIIKGEGKTVTIDLFDQYDDTTNFTSMSRTTGYTCTAAATLIAEKKFTSKGIIPPEYIGEEETCYNRVIDYLKKRNVNIRIR